MRHCPHHFLPDLCKSNCAHVYAVICLFLFSCYRVLPDLHSFPTRRSSDLSQLFTAQSELGDESQERRCEHVLVGRSEEHTSELQSHSDLVCRLLLEKKKSHRPRPVLAQIA